LNPIPGQTEKDKYITYMWNLKKMVQRTYLQNRNRVTDVKNKLWLPRGKAKGRVERDKCRLGLTIYTKLYITNKDLLYNTGSASILCKTDVGKKCKTEWI